MNNKKKTIKLKRADEFLGLMKKLDRLSADYLRKIKQIENKRKKLMLLIIRD